MRGTPIKCGHCRGTGRAVLSSVYEFTLKRLRKNGPSTGADLARLEECKATAVNNRLRVLERYGLATSRWDGRKRIYTARDK